MFKKRLVTLGATLFALIALVGAGFSSWYFSNQRRADVFSNVVVTHANTFGQFSNVSNGTYLLMLDQPTKDAGTITMHNIVLKNGTSETNSVAVETLNATWTVSLSSYKDTLKNGTDVTIENSYIEYSVIVYIKKSTLGEYVEVGSNTGFSNSNLHAVAGEHNHREEYEAYKLTFTDFSSPETDKVYTADEEKTATGAYVNIPSSGNVTVDFVFNLADVPFQWKNGKEPTSFQQYQDMVNTLGCKDVTSAGDVVGGKIYETAGQDLIIEFAVYNTNEDVPTIDATGN